MKNNDKIRDWFFDVEEIINLEEDFLNILMDFCEYNAENSEYICKTTLLLKIIIEKHNLLSTKYHEFVKLR